MFKRFFEWLFCKHQYEIINTYSVMTASSNVVNKHKLYCPKCNHEKDVFVLAYEKEDKEHKARMEAKERYIRSNRE